MSKAISNQKKVVFLSPEVVTEPRTDRIYKGGLTDSLLDTAIHRCLSGKDLPSLCYFEPVLRFSEDVISQCRLKALELLQQLAETDADDKDWERALHYGLPLDPALDRPTKLQTMTSGSFVLYCSRYLGYYALQFLRQEMESLNSLVLDQPFESEESAESLGTMIEDLRYRCGTDEQVAFVDIEAFLSPRQAMAWKAMVAGLTQREIQASLGISPTTQARIRRLIWDYLSHSNAR